MMSFVLGFSLKVTLSRDFMLVESNRVLEFHRRLLRFKAPVSFRNSTLRYRDVLTTHIFVRLAKEMYQSSCCRHYRILKFSTDRGRFVCVLTLFAYSKIGSHA